MMPSRTPTPAKPDDGGVERVVVPFKPRPAPRRPEPDRDDPGPNPAA